MGESNHNTNTVTKKRKKSVSPVALLVFAIIFGIIAGAGIWVYKAYNAVTDPDVFVSSGTPHQWTKSPSTPTPSVEKTVTPDETVAPGETPLPEETPSPATPEPYSPSEDDILEGNKDYVNILLIGYDEDEERDSRWNFFRTDTLILCTVYLGENKRVVLTSIPRDTRVAFSFYDFDPNNMDKINSIPSRAYYAGVTDTYAEICKTTSRLFGNATVDYYMAVNMDVFVDIIDALGGIDYDVDLDINYDGKILVHKGYQHLTGKQALQYVQYRRTATADIGRTERQRKFLKSAFAQLKASATVSSLMDVYNIVKDEISSNLTYAQVLALAKIAMNEVDISKVSEQVFPGYFDTINNISYWSVNQETRKYLIAEMFKIPYDYQN